PGRPAGRKRSIDPSLAWHGGSVCVVVGETVVGEQVAIAGIQEQLRALDCLVKLSAASRRRSRIVSKPTCRADEARNNDSAAIGERARVNLRYVLSMSERTTQTLMMALLPGPVGVR